MKSKIVSRYAFQSKSSPGRHYETLRYDNGTLSCNCPGWTKNALRVCKHTRGVQMQLAIDAMGKERIAMPTAVALVKQGKPQSLRKIRYEE